MSLFFILHGWIPSGQTVYIYIYLYKYTYMYLCISISIQKERPRIIARNTVYFISNLLQRGFIPVTMMATLEKGNIHKFSELILISEYPNYHSDL